MGTDNRKRRAAKQKKRSQRARQGRSGRRVDQSWRGEYTADELVAGAIRALVADDVIGARTLVDDLVEHERAVVANVFQVRAEGSVARAWADGWQPADLCRFSDRELDAIEADLVRLAIRAQARTYRALGESVAPDWMAQLDASAGRGPEKIETLADPWPDVVAGGVRALAFLATLPRLPILTPPPSAWREGMAAAGRATVPDDVLAKVRALMAKAESTEFEAEADALTAKAQQLMTRHRIDRLTLAASAAAADLGEEPVGRRLGVENPYADTKATLLTVVAQANDCKAVWGKSVGFSTVMGFADDIAVVEELYTSLLVQATAAMRREGSKSDAFGRSRTTRFRRSFLTSYAYRIGDRLDEAARAAVAEADAEQGGALLPVLVARSGAVADATAAAFPETSTFSPTATDAEGWHAGRVYADQADLSVGDKLTR